MRVLVQPLRLRGMFRTADALRSEAPLTAELSMRERKDFKSGRVLRIARVVDPKDALEVDVLPELHDVQLLAVKGNEMTLSGFERLDGQDLMQSWHVQVA